jgi:hypothetical protein
MSMDTGRRPSFATRNSGLNDFPEKYETSIRNMGEYINRIDPQYVVALSRTGPRLLECLIDDGLIDIDVDIITEKSLRCKSHEELADAEDIVLFDDIVIAGTTLWTKLNQLVEDYDADFTVVSLALDKDTVGLFSSEYMERFPEMVGFIKLKSGKVRYKTLVVLDREERFEFVREVVHRLSLMNKPYDIDWPIFNTYLNPKEFNEIKKLSNIYRITTNRQYEGGLERYTLLIDDSEINEFFEKVFRDEIENPEICKLRLYYDKKSHLLRIVPILSIGFDSVPSSAAVFSEEFQPINELIKSICPPESSSQNSPAIKISAIWYLSSYLFGLYTIQNLNKAGLSILNDLKPNQFLVRRDLTFIFGEHITTELIKGLDQAFEQIEARLSNVERTASDSESEPIDPAKYHPDNFGGIQKDWIDKISGGVRDKIDQEHNLLSQITHIFEQLYLEVEVPAQKEISSLEGEVDEMERVYEANSDRLTTGFSASEIAGIIYHYSGGEQDFTELRRKVSIATDILVDKGVQIPILEFSGGVRRSYRHGETAFVLYEEFKSVMESVLYEIIGQSSIKAKPLEKIIVLLWKFMDDMEIVDDLHSDGPSDEILIKNTFLPFGQTLDMMRLDTKFATSLGGESKYMEPEELELDTKRQYFTEWARRNNLIEKVDSGEDRYTFSGDSVVKSANFPTDSLSYSDLSVLTQFSRILFRISENDPDPCGFNWLLGLTNCSDPKTFCMALQEDFRALFHTPASKNNKYTIEHTLETVEQFFDDGAFHAHHAVDYAGPAMQCHLKTEMWERIVPSINRIHEQFTESASERDEEAYASHVADYLDDIKKEHQRTIEDDDAQSYLMYTKTFGELLGIYGRLVYSFVRVCELAMAGVDRSPDELDWITVAQLDPGEDEVDAVSQFNACVKAWNYAVGNPQRDSWAPAGFRDFEALDSTSKLPDRFVGFAAVQQRPVPRSRFEKIVGQYHVLENVHWEHFVKREAEKYIQKFDKPVWESTGSIHSDYHWLLAFQVVGDEPDSGASRIETELNAVQPEFENLGFLFAKDIDQLEDQVTSLVAVAEQAGKGLALGICSVMDVGEKLEYKPSISRMETGDHFELAQAFVEAGTAQLDESASNWHVISISDYVRVHWKRGLPEALLDEISQLRQDGDYRTVQTEQGEDDYYCTITSFVQESTTLSYFTDD